MDNSISSDSCINNGHATPSTSGAAAAQSGDPLNRTAAELQAQLERNALICPVEGASSLTRRDMLDLAQSYIPAFAAADAGLFRVDSYAGRCLVGKTEKTPGDYSGIAIPYLNGGKLIDFRLRREFPEFEPARNGGKAKAINRYMSPPSVSGLTYGPPASLHVAAEPGAKVPCLFVEGEKKALAMAWYFFQRRQAVRVIGLPGVWNWKTSRKEIERDSNGHVCHQTSGLIENLDSDWSDEHVWIMFDTNVEKNPNVRAARKSLTNELRARGAAVWHITLPDDDQRINGPDDLLAIKGPDAMARLIEQQTGQDQKSGLRFYGNEKQNVVPLAAEVWEALAASEARARSLFFVAGNLARIQPLDDRLRIESATPDLLSYRLAHLADWYTWKRGETAERGDTPEMLRQKQTTTTPPKSLIRHMLAAPLADVPLPILRRTVMAPVFAADGRLISQPGFDADSGIYYLPTCDVPAVPETVLAEDLAKARK